MAREHRLFEADAFEDGVGAEPAGELAHALDRLVAAFAYDVGCAELTRQGDPVGVAAEDDNLLSAEAPGGDHAAQADGAVTDDGRGLPRADPGGDGRMVARPHDIRKGQERGHQRVVLTDRQHEEGAVRLGDPQGFGLRSVDVARAEESSVDARRM